MYKMLHELADAGMCKKKVLFGETESKTEHEGNYEAGGNFLGEYGAFQVLAVRWLKK